MREKGGGKLIHTGSRLDMTRRGGVGREKKRKEKDLGTFEQFRNII